MARFKDYDYAQDLMVAVNLQEQLLPGTLEHAINHLIDSRIGLEGSESKYNNDETGQKAYDPRLLLKVVLYAYSQGILSSRKMEQACRTNIVFMALGCGMRPDHSAFAAFVSGLGDEAEKVFQEVLSPATRQDCWATPTSPWTGSSFLPTPPANGAASMPTSSARETRF